MHKIVVFLLTLAFISSQNLESFCYREKNKKEACASMTDDSIAFATSEDKEGWHLFNVETNSKFPNDQQAYAAGFLEGHIYFNYINYHFINVRDTFLGGSAVLSDRLNSFLDQQKAFYNDIAKKNSNDYEQTLSLVLQQHDGLWNGYSVGYDEDAKKEHPKLTRAEFDMLSNLGDLVDLIPAYPKPKQEALFRGRRDCTGFVRIIGNNLYVAHNTHNLYSMMNRIFKFYNFKMKLSSGKVINGYKFNSRPGDLNSKDDYYQLTNKMAVIETSLDIYDPRKYYKLSPFTVPKWIRTSIANKIATNNEEWIKLFLTHNSGTHNNQWLIVDFNRFRAGKRTGIVNMVEQTPNIDGVYTEDMSAELFRDGYFASYNAAYFEEVKEDIGCPDSKDYFHAKRFYILRELNKKVEKIDDVKKIMLYQDSTELCDTIGARCDLLTTSAKRPYGAIDVKLMNDEMLDKMENALLYGIPYFEGISKPFSFDDWPTLTHHGITKVSDNNWIIA